MRGDAVIHAHLGRVPKRFVCAQCGEPTEENIPCVRCNTLGCVEQCRPGGLLVPCPPCAGELETEEEINREPIRWADLTEGK